MKNKKMDIVYEDKYLLIINKPTKLLTIATEKEKSNTLYNEASLYVKKKYPKNKIFIVNRLDKDTSGIVVFAKDEKTKHLLQDNWDKYALSRKYIALLHGKVKEKSKTLIDYLMETTTNLVFISHEKGKGKKAITKFDLIKYVNNDSLVDIEIFTGRKNQIRVQLAGYGNPIKGDIKYGIKKTYQNRLMLHASYLKLIHPITHETLELNASMPKEFKILF